MTPPTKVTKEALLAKIAAVDYVVMPDGRTTVCQLTMQNGFTVRGESSCVSVENFNKELGEKYAYEKAFDAAWAFEGYLLAELRHREARGDENQHRDEQEGARRDILLALMEVVNVATPEELLDRVVLAFKPAMTHPGLAPHQHRVVVEKEDLDDRLDKLNAFFSTSIFDTLPVTEQARLRRQAVAMRIYSEVLDERIQAFGSVLEIKP